MGRSLLRDEWLGNRKWIGDQNSAEQDAVDSEALYDVLEKQVIPEFFDRPDDMRIPHKWVGKMKHSIATLSPRFNTSRMVMEYAQLFYLKEEGLATRKLNRSELGRSSWKESLQSGKKIPKNCDANNRDGPILFGGTPTVHFVALQLELSSSYLFIADGAGCIKCGGKLEVVQCLEEDCTSSTSWRVRTAKILRRKARRLFRSQIH